MHLTLAAGLTDFSRFKQRNLLKYQVTASLYNNLVHNLHHIVLTSQEFVHSQQTLSNKFGLQQVLF